MLELLLLLQFDRCVVVNAAEVGLMSVVIVLISTVLVLSQEFRLEGLRLSS